MAGLVKLWDAKQTEAETGIPVSRLYELARQDLIPHVHLGRQIRFSEQAIRAWVADGGAALPGGWRREPAAV